MGSLSLLQGIFPTHGSKPGLLHCRQILYHLSHQGSPSTHLPAFKFWTFKDANVHSSNIKCECNRSLPSISHCWYFFSSTISQLTSLLPSVTLPASSLDASPCVPAVVLHYCIFQGIVRFKLFYFLSFFSILSCEKYYKPITVQYYILNYVSWVPRLTVWDLRNKLDLIIELLKQKSFVCRWLTVLACKQLNLSLNPASDTYKCFNLGTFLSLSVSWNPKYKWIYLKGPTSENVMRTKWVNISSVQLLSDLRLFATPWTTALRASLSITNCRSLPKPMSIESVMPSNHLIFCRPLLLLPSIFPSIRVFSNESALCIRWTKYWSFSFSTSPSNETLVKCFKQCLVLNTKHYTYSHHIQTLFVRFRKTHSVA